MKVYKVLLISLVIVAVFLLFEARNAAAKFQEAGPTAFPPSCADSDGGQFPDIAGYVDGIGLSGWPYTKYDTCSTTTSVKEFFCNNTTYRVKTFSCPYGCSNGACLQPVCTDGDGDRYAVEGGVCGLADCDDNNPFVNPGMAEVCGNGIDDNCNGKVDADDQECSSARNVIVIGWDGVQRDHLWECYNRQLPECSAGLPNLAALGGNVIRDFTITSGDTATKPGWAQILTGYNADVTGVFSNGQYQPIPQGYTIFEKLENYFGPQNIVTMFISGKNEHTGGACIGDPTYKNGQPVIEDLGQPWCLTKNYLDYYENNLRLNNTVGTRALELLELHSGDQFFAFFLFREPDASGHVTNENSSQYTKMILDDDLWLGKIMNKLTELGLNHNTTVYVVSDHGFDEGLDRHGNAPFTIFATNDSLIVREGDRKDIAATILEHYGVSVGAIGDAPALNGFSLYALPPFSCVPEGQAYLDYPGAPACCSGLTRISLDKIYGTNMFIAATGGTGDNSGYCTNYGDGICTPPENRMNAPEDCQ